MAKIAPLVHKDPNAADEVLAKEVLDHCLKNPPIQLVVEMLIILRGEKLPWWTPEQRREAYTATARMQMLQQRPDVRARIMKDVTNAPPGFARRGEPDRQASYIDEFLLEDVPVRTFENAFDPIELVVYGDAAALFYQFMDAMPWDEDALHQDLIATLIAAFLSDRKDDGKRPSNAILTHWEVVNAIDPILWHTKIPLETRVAVHKAWLELQKDKRQIPYSAEHVLGIVTPKVITHSIKLVDLKDIFALAEQKMGFERPMPKEDTPPPPEVETTGDASPKA